jgi:putative flippase GtrA
MRLPFWELAKYVGVGAVATIVDYVSYILLTRLFGIPVLAANPLSYLLGNGVSFTGHHFITFRSREKPLPEYIRFAVVSAAGLGVSQLVIMSALWLGFPDLISKAASVLISGLFNYLSNRFWTFRKRR